jgi:uncharacterized protein YecE (DUF72 family)
MKGVFVGTSGYSYADWEGVAYPKGSPAGDRLRHYASTGLNAVELNAAFQSQPRAEWQQRAVEQAPEGFLFTIRLPITVTHQPFDDAARSRSQLGRGLEAARLFGVSLGPLRSTGRLACALASFPIGVRPTPFARHYIEAVRESLEGTELAVEFRATEWGTDETVEWLRSRGIALAASDTPRHESLLPLWNRPTTRFAYFRFHGRNPHGFETRDERCDYLYTADELAGLAAEVKAAAEKTERTFVFFNNSPKGSAFVNALRFAETMGLRVGPGSTPLRQPDLFGNG